MTNEELITNELKEQYPEIFNRICKDLDITITEEIKEESSYMHQVKSFKYEYEEIFYGICNELNIPKDTDISILSEDKLKDIINELKYEHRWIWKEL